MTLSPRLKTNKVTSQTQDWFRKEAIRKRKTEGKTTEDGEKESKGQKSINFNMTESLLPLLVLLGLQEGNVLDLGKRVVLDVGEPLLLLLLSKDLEVFLANSSEHFEGHFLLNLLHLLVVGLHEMVDVLDCLSELTLIILGH